MTKKQPVPKDEFNEEILKSKAQGRLTERAGQLIFKLVSYYQDTNESMKYDSEDIKQDVRSVALTIICEKWYKFNEKEYNNAFSYFTTMARNGLMEGMNRHTRNKNNSVLRYDTVFDESV
ncbi:hypothetical protein BPT24_171 [Tenacibaculum phage pT24]|uniref:Uncharacterized protein n=1 Tax=Tenacibaculum phage pT24 TaxID=1880590 RepID=A0A1B4XWX9_9CAUD|nr:hypothetical protein HYP10_gp171 [Tenacibaculum phage pT24]BAV39297.1 hypothetical protein BPT24_171 [Tenacibaculum phage pT24]